MLRMRTLAAAHVALLHGAHVHATVLARGARIVGPDARSRNPFDGQESRGWRASLTYTSTVLPLETLGC